MNLQHARGIYNIMKKFLLILGILIGFLSPVHAQNDSIARDLTFTIPSYTKIVPVTSPVLTANVTNRTGNLHAPLSTKFKVISNKTEPLTLYLSAHVNTDSGMEPAMFEQGGQVYIAFANLSKLPTASSLMNCKMGSMPKDSPGIVAYPVTSITGTKKQHFMSNKSKYELTVESGISYVNVNVGSNVLRSSFAGNDPRGFYQAVLSLTEIDM